MDPKKQRALDAIEALCTFLVTRDAYRYQTAAALREAVSGTVDNFQTIYCSANWWGGAGSMVDYWARDASETSRYEAMLIELADAVEAWGLQCPAAKQRGNQLRGL
jgi:hypothetical protein